MRESDANWYEKEILRLLVLSGLFLVGWWLPTFGEQLGTGDVDTARRVVGILTGIWLIADGNRAPKLMLVPPSHDDSAAVQRFQRFTGWSWVLVGVVYVLLWLVLPVDQAYNASSIVLFCGFLLFAAQMFLLVRRARHLHGERRGI